MAKDVIANARQNDQSNSKIGRSDEMETLRTKIKLAEEKYNQELRNKDLQY